MNCGFLFPDFPEFFDPTCPPSSSVQTSGPEYGFSELDLDVPSENFPNMIIENENSESDDAKYHSSDNDSDVAISASPKTTAATSSDLLLHHTIGGGNVTSNSLLVEEVVTSQLAANDSLDAEWSPEPGRPGTPTDKEYYPESDEEEDFKKKSKSKSSSSSSSSLSSSFKSKQILLTKVKKQKQDRHQKISRRIGKVERNRGACEKHKRDRKRCPLDCVMRKQQPQQF